MRSIHLSDALRVRFPGRDEAFDAGVEIGILAALMSLETREFSRQISLANLEQARALGRRLGYHLVESESVCEETTLVTFRNRAFAPKLTLVRQA